MTTVGLIGSGNIGGTIARLALASGHTVILSNSRGPETLRGLAAELGPHASAGTRQQAAAEGDIVVVTVPLRAYPDIADVPMAGKVVIDTGNYYPERDGQVTELDSGQLTDSELLAGQLTGASVVKAFNNIFFKHLLSLPRPGGAAGRSYLPISGDSAAAKAKATAFLDEIGYGAVDNGTLAEGWRQQPGTPVYGAPYGPFENEHGTPAGEDVIRAALAKAAR